MSLSPFILVFLSLLFLFRGFFFLFLRRLLAFFLLVLFGFFSFPRGLLFILLALLVGTLLAKLSLVLFGLLEELCLFGGFVFGLLLLLTFLTHLGLLIVKEEVVAFGLLLLILAGVLLVDTGTEVNGVTSEGDVHKL